MAGLYFGKSLVYPVCIKLALFLSISFLLSIVLYNFSPMWTASRNVLLSFLGTASVAVDLAWHEPSQTYLNDLEAVMGESGVHGFIYNTSQMPDDKYGIYNYCNMPHVRKTEYPVPDPKFQLQYVEVIHRHHKRTPYSSNAFPVEPYHWDCDDQALYRYGVPLNASGSEHENNSAKAYWKGYISDVNPFIPFGWIGSCSFPQITAGGLDDSWVHGHDLYGVYHDLLDFVPSRGNDWNEEVVFRVTQNQITSQVAGMLISGFYKTTESVLLMIQAEGIDSLEPQYPCPSASSKYNSIKSRSNERWKSHLDAAKELYATLDAISGVPSDDSGFHASFDHYYDNLSSRQCHDKPLPCSIANGSLCIDQGLADNVYRLGHWEYSHIYRDDPDSLPASAASMGVWFAELASHVRAAVEGSSKVKYFHNVAHDGSMSRVLSVLQVAEMVWPGMGAEVVFEVWKREGEEEVDGEKSAKEDTLPEYFMRILFGGQVLKSSSPTLGAVDMLPMEVFLGYIDGLIGENASLIKGKCQ